jgi:hypothetical protein
VKACRVGHSSDESSKGNGDAQPMSVSGVVLPLLPVLASLGQGPAAGGALPLATLKVRRTPPLVRACLWLEWLECMLRLGLQVDMLNHSWLLCFLHNNSQLLSAGVVESSDHVDC